MTRAPSPCDVCPTSRCCTVFDPELTGPDVARLSAALGLAPGLFSRAAPVHARHAGADGIRLGTDETWELRLTRTTAGELAVGEGGARRCVFLLHVGPGVNRCGVYGIRPMLCRTFPTAVTGGGVFAGSPPGVCPDGAWDDAVLDAHAIGETHGRADAERARWRAFLDVWNEPSWQTTLATVDRDGRLSLLYATIEKFEDVASTGATLGEQRAAVERARDEAFRALPRQR